MVDTTTFLLFCITSFVLMITPGPNMLYIIAGSVGQGRKEGIVSALGVDTGFLVHIIAAVIGLSALLVSSAVAFHIAKYLGAAYLIYLGARILLERAEPKHYETQNRKSLWKVYYQGFLTSVLNPKVAVFFLAFFPQFVHVSRGAVAGQILFLGMAFIFIGIFVDLIVALLAGAAGNWLRDRIRFWRVQKWLTGSVFVALGVGTALTGCEKE